MIDAEGGTIRMRPIASRYRMIKTAWAALPDRIAPMLMKTRVNTDTWITVGSNIPMTASAGQREYITAVRPTATISSTILCPALGAAVNAAQAISTPQTTKPNQDALSIQTAPIAISTKATATFRSRRKYLRSCSQEISVV